jgi:DNA polymerase III subunit gamma/tau
MSHLALYRKYRPQQFSDFVGQKHIVDAISAAVSQDIISHAYLFDGPKGTGKTSMARLLAKAINCQNRKPGQFEPCNKCDSCLDINNGRAIDLIEIDAASNRGIDDIRQLREDINFLPIKSQYKVLILDESHRLTKDAVNALLKTLEEPPAHAVFILATTEVYNMLPTIVSRCQRFDFHNLSLEEIKGQLAHIAELEKISFEPEAISLIAQSAQGSLRNAQSLLDACLTLALSHKKPILKIEEVRGLLGLIEVEKVSELIDLILAKETGKAIIFLNNLSGQGISPIELGRAMVNYLRYVLLFQINPSFDSFEMMDLSSEEKEGMKKQGQGFTQQKLCSIIDLFLEAQRKTYDSSISLLPLELAVVRSIEE